MADPKMGFKEALQVTRESGAEMKQEGVSKMQSFFEGARKTAQRIGSALNTGLEFGLGMTKKESRGMLKDAVKFELEKAEDAAAGKLYDLAGEFDGRCNALVEGGRQTWQRFDQEHLMPLNSNIEGVLGIITKTATELPGFALDQAKAWTEARKQEAIDFGKKVGQGLEEVGEIAGATLTELPAYAYDQMSRGVESWVEEKRAVGAEKKAEKRERKAMKAFDKYMAFSEKAGVLRQKADEHRATAVRVNGGFSGAATKLRLRALEDAAVGD